MISAGCRSCCSQESPRRRSCGQEKGAETCFTPYHLLFRQGTQADELRQAEEQRKAEERRKAEVLPRRPPPHLKPRPMQCSLCLSQCHPQAAEAERQAEQARKAAAATPARVRAPYAACKGCSNTDCSPSSTTATSTRASQTTIPTPPLLSTSTTNFTAWIPPGNSA